MAAVISRIGGLSPNLSPALKQKPAIPPLADLQTAEYRAAQQASATAASQASQADRLDAEARAASLSAQRQRLITVNRAQVMKFAVPVLVGLSAILGRRAGMQGVLSALGGGLAGLQSGMNRQYQNAYRQYQAKQKELQEEAAGYQKQAEAIRKDEGTTLSQKAKMLENLTSGLVSAQDARERVAGGLEKAQITGHDDIIKQGMSDQARMYASDSKLRELSFRQQAAQRGGALAARANASITPALMKQAAALLPGSGQLEQKHLVEYAHTRWAIHGGAAPDLAAALAHLKTLGLVTPASVNAALVGARAKLSGMEAGDAAAASGGKQAPATQFAPETTQALIQQGAPKRLVESPMGRVAAAAGAPAAGFHQTVDELRVLAADAIANHGEIQYPGNYGEHGTFAFSRQAVAGAMGAMLHTLKLSPEDLSALYARGKAGEDALVNLTKVGTSLATRVAGMKANAALALRSAQSLGLGSFVPYNKAVMLGGRLSSDPALASYVSKIKAYMADLATVERNSPSGSPDDETLKLAASQVADAQSPAALRAAMEGAIAAAENVSGAYDANSSALLRSLTLKGEARSVRGEGASASGSSGGSEPPAVGAVEGGYRFEGGDPSNPTNWKKVH